MPADWSVVRIDGADNDNVLLIRHRLFVLIEYAFNFNRLLEQKKLSEDSFFCVSGPYY